MKLKDTFMSSPICVKILKYQCISKNFPLLCRQFFPFITLKQKTFFSQLQLANIFFYEKGNPPPNKKDNGSPLRSHSQKVVSYMQDSTVRKKWQTRGVLTFKRFYHHPFHSYVLVGRSSSLQIIQITFYAKNFGPF